jgi:hypothetical protein
MAKTVGGCLGTPHATPPCSMGQRQECVDCNLQSPPTDTNYTLISSRHGWRLTRLRSAHGQFVAEWRCPQCWTAYKRRERTPASDNRIAVVPLATAERPHEVFARATRRLRRPSGPPRGL